MRCFKLFTHKEDIFLPNAIDRLIDLYDETIEEIVRGNIYLTTDKAVAREVIMHDYNLEIRFTPKSSKFEKLRRIK